MMGLLKVLHGQTYPRIPQEAAVNWKTERGLTAHIRSGKYPDEVVKREFARYRGFTDHYESKLGTGVIDKVAAAVRQCYPLVNLDWLGNVQKMLQEGAKWAAEYFRGTDIDKSKLLEIAGEFEIVREEHPVEFTDWWCSR